MLRHSPAAGKQSRGEIEMVLRFSREPTRKDFISREFSIAHALVVFLPCLSSLLVAVHRCLSCVYFCVAHGVSALFIVVVRGCSLVLIVCLFLRGFRLQQCSRPNGDFALFIVVVP